MKLEFESNTSTLPFAVSQHPAAGNSENGAAMVSQTLQAGIKAAQSGNRYEARQLLIQVTEAEPQNEIAWLWMASISEYPEELIIFLNNVLRVNPHNERALEWMATTKSLLSKTFVQRGGDAAHEGSKDFARQCFLQAIAHNNQNEAAWQGLAEVSTANEEKISHLQKVLTINAENETAQQLLAAVKHQAAEVVLSKANRAAISGDRAEAQKWLHEVFKFAPELEEAWILKSYLADSFSEKVTCFEKVLTFNPANEMALSGLAALRAMMARTETDEIETPAAAVEPTVETVEEVTAAPVEERTEEISIEEPTEEITSEEKAEETAPFEMETEETATAGIVTEEFSAEEISAATERNLDFAVEENFEANRLTAESEFASELSFTQYQAVETTAATIDETAEMTIEQAIEEVETTSVEAVAATTDPAVETVETATDDEFAETDFYETAEHAAPQPQSEESFVEEIEAAASAEEAAAENGLANRRWNDKQPNEEFVARSFATETEEIEDPETEIEETKIEETAAIEVADAANIEAEDVEIAPAETIGAETVKAETIEAVDTEIFEERFAAPAAIEWAPAETVFFAPANEIDETLDLEPLNAATPAVKYLSDADDLLMTGDSNSILSAAKNTAGPVRCPFCETANEPNAFVCSSCRTILTLSDLEMLLAHTEADPEILRPVVERLEIETSGRFYNVETLRTLAIGQINLKNLRQGMVHLQRAAQLKPNDVMLGSQVNFLKIRMAEIEQHESAASQAIKGKTILVADDSATIRKLIASKLEKSGHQVICAVDGVDALEKIKEVLPDLILLDIMMPQLDGYQVCKLVRSNEATKKVPIVMISGKDGFFDKVRGRMAGTSGYITKPFGPETLMRTVETYIVQQKDELIKDELIGEAHQ